MTTGQPARLSDPSGRSRLPIWAWVLVGVAGFGMTLALPLVIAVIALVVLLAGVVTLSRGTPSWLRRSKGSIGAVTAGAAAVLLLATGVNAAMSPSSPQQTVPFVAESNNEERPPSPSATSREETVIEVIAFAQSTVEDPSLPEGETRITTPGEDGERTLTYRVEMRDGLEVGRELISTVVTKEPITQVSIVGTYVAPLTLVPDAAACDPNYADACVPISSDVDCAWGSGNGPAYFDGVARVVGVDVYDLDRDGDGYACEQ